MEAFISSIVVFAGTFAPQGWAFCNGQLLSIAENEVLFSLIGTTYGGDGMTTFALPNLQGRVSIHPGHSPGTSSYELGLSGGTEGGPLTSAQMPAHTHSVAVTIHASASNQSPSDNPSGAVMHGGSGHPIFSPTPDGVTTMNPGMATTVVGSAGGNQAVPVVQPYECVNYIICLEGIYPSRP